MSQVNENVEQEVVEQGEKKPHKPITVEEAAKRFMVDVERPAVLSYDVRHALGDDDNEFRLLFDMDTVFNVVDANGSRQMTLEQLLPIVNEHNMCVAQKVFGGNDVVPFVYKIEGQEQTTFTPVEGKPWGFDKACIAWYNETIQGQNVLSALVLVPGYRCYGIKDRDDAFGLLLEDTDRSNIYVPFNEFPDVFRYETKNDFLQNPNKNIDPDSFKFNDNDFLLIATRNINFAASNGLQQVSGRDFKKLWKRYQETGQLDSKTDFSEDNVFIAEPWIAYFRRKFKATGKELFLAYVGAPGYTRDEITPGDRENNIKPCFYMRDRNGERIHVRWLNYHDCLDYPDFKSWNESPERKKHKSGRKGGYPGVNRANDKPMLASAAADAAKVSGNEDDFDMGDLGVDKM